ncbi:unnamed protein product [Litomosoides sigmodontis]|uniref:Uncharacterized protein n=1 Tax=Litomosoides sigmodontis TaxID=42156 RepID=A0A3P7K693_LITSI|nr:unnamed protein product [Litomosoides sigmodontis]
MGLLKKPSFLSSYQKDYLTKITYMSTSLQTMQQLSLQNGYGAFSCQLSLSTVSGSLKSEVNHSLHGASTLTGVSGLISRFTQRCVQNALTSLCNVIGDVGICMVFVV